MCTFITYLLVAFIVVVYSEDTPVISTKLGSIIGYNDKSHDGRTFTSFEGIPFAKPPIGELRFKDPEPKEPWVGTWIANRTHRCSQSFMDGSDTLYGFEDCLYLNVYVPGNIEPNKKLDVVIFIHGGAFMYGSSADFRPDYLMDRDIIVVIINYRLGVFGFLSTEDVAIPGNMGMKDQTLAMKWVKNNIDSFGGNPESITITGCSAGAASVHFHYLSPLSKGLFNSGIANSGSALNAWTIQEAPLQKAQHVGKIVGCNVDTTHELLNCLQQRPVQEIFSAAADLFKYMIFPMAPFALVVDKYSDAPFMPEHPYVLLKNGKIHDVPLIASVTTEEGICPAGVLLNDLSEINKRWEELLPVILDYEYTIPNERKLEVSAILKKHYFGGAELNKDNLPELIKLCGDRYFYVDMEEALRMHSKHSKSPVHLYKFGYRGEHSASAYFGVKENIGVSHGDDYIYILKSTMLPMEHNQQDEQMKIIFLDMIRNFAQNKKATSGGVEWRPVKPTGKLQYLKINSPTDIVNEEADELGDSQFWKSLNIMENGALFNVKDEL